MPALHIFVGGSHMKFVFKRIIAAVMAVLTVSSVVSITGVTVGAASKQPSEIERVVVDCRSAEAFAKTSKVYVHTPDQYDPDPLTGGKYSFHSGMKAMQVEYNNGAKPGNEYRILPMFNLKNNLTDEYKYLVVVYAAKTTQTFNITVWNGGRQGPLVNALSGGKNTKAKFVATEPVDISSANAEGKSSLWRLINGIHFTLTFVCGDKDAQFFIKEYAFFKSPEGAKAYYKGVDLNKAPEEYGANAVTPTPAKAGNEPTSSAGYSGPITHSGANIIPVTYHKFDEPAEAPKASANEPELEPVIMSFESEEAFKKSGTFPAFMGSEANAAGKFEFVTLDDGTGCIKLTYNAYSNYVSYRMMPLFRSASTAPTAQHKYIRITYMTEDYTNSALTLRNNKTGKTVTLADDVSLSRGKFVTSPAVNIEDGEFLSRYSNGIQNALGFTNPQTDSAYYIKEIAFFSSEKQAYAHYGDEKKSSIKYTELLFGTEGKGMAQHDEVLWGVSTESTDTLDITYAQNTVVCNLNNLHYMAKIKPSEKKLTDEKQRYMRVLYSADNPEGVDSAAMVMICDKDNQRVLVSDDVRDTNGQFVLTDPIYLTELMAWRFANSIFNTLVVTAVPDGGKYSIKAIYFFDTRSEAEAFELSSKAHAITVAGNDISKYQIVVGESAPDNVVSEAKELAAHIKKLSGYDIKVVTDSTAHTGYEILYGLSSRPAAVKAHGETSAKGEAFYGVKTDGNDLIVSSSLGLTFASASDIVKNNLFYYGASEIPEKIEIPAGIDLSYTRNALDRLTFWPSGESAADPTVLNFDFTADEGYINEDNGEKNWTFENGCYKTAASSFAASYIHTYEKNVTVNAKLSFPAAAQSATGSVGVMARVNSDHAYVKAGYDFTAKEWFIETRDGRDFYLERTASFPAEITADTVYGITLTVSGETASLAVNGQTVIEGARLNHFSPGRIAVYAENAGVSFDSLDVTLATGESNVFKYVSHTRIPYDSYLEGGTVHERADGSLSYVHPYGADVAYKSLDGGISWQKSELWSDNHKYSYSNMLKLANGSFLRVAQKSIGGKAYKIAQLSTDDGITWQGENIICESNYKDTAAYGSNMNDKLSQASVSGKWAGRIFYVQTYESTAATGGGSAVEGRNIFCRFYYSDDNGITWQKSETDSWTIPGLENEGYFGEAKLLECADGTIRMYNSWNFLGCMVYSESTDGGKTFGPLVKMENIPCPVSSMQFARDPYAENDYTYYMVWLNNEQASANLHVPRARLSLAKTTDGKTWEYLGDVMRWESTYMIGNNLINHAVDPFVYVTRDSVIAGTGFSEHLKLAGEGGPAGHLGQRQHIYTIRKDTLPTGTVINP